MHEQVALAYLWDYTVRGVQWTWTMFHHDTAMLPATLRKNLDLLAEEGVLIKSEDGDSKHPRYEIECAFLPSREPPPVKITKQAKPKFQVEEWMIRAMQMWGKHRGGVVGPRDISMAMGLAVKVQGAKVVLDAFERFCICDGDDPTFWPLKRFSETMGQWKAKEHTEPEGRVRGFVEEPHGT